MNVQELIDELMKIEDKSKNVLIYGRWSGEWENDFEVDEAKFGDYVYISD
jgi:hypothetical protein